MSTLLKNLSITVLALVITLVLPLSVIGEDQVILTTIMPTKDTLRVKRGAVGLTYIDKTDSEIGDSNLIIEGTVGVGTPTPDTQLEVEGGAIKATDGLIIQVVATKIEETSMPKGNAQIWLTSDVSDF